jgi:hypothetical protein
VTNRFGFQLRLVALSALMFTSGTLMPWPTLAARNSCPGDYQTSHINPWPANVTFAVPMPTTESDATQARIAGLMFGLKSAGLAVGPQGTLTMHLVFTIRPPKGKSSKSNEGGIYSDLSWRRPGNTFGRDLNDPMLPGSFLHVTVIVNDNAENRPVWLASLECTVRSGDTELLAREIGTDIGQMMAQSLRSEGR